jgi:DNA-binding FadR family transcriptional regulator
MMIQQEQDLASVRRYLCDQGFAQNDRLPSERQLADQLGLTRNRVRGSLRKLASEGLVWRHVGQGTYFGPRLSPFLTRKNVDTLAATTYPREVMEARLSFEPEMARLAALNSTGQHVSEIELCLERMRGTTDWNVWAACDAQFHRLVAAASGNALLLAMFDTMQAGRSKQIWGRLGNSPFRELRYKHVLAEHGAVLAAIRERDPDGAAEAMRRHLTSARTYVLPQ